MDERAFGLRWTKWLKGDDGYAWVRSLGGAVFWELKVVPGEVCGIGLIREHQAVALGAIEGVGPSRVVTHKISDMSAGYKPFDGFTACQGANSFLVVGFRGGKEVRVFPGAVVWARFEAWRRRRGKVEGLGIEEGIRVPGAV